MKRSQHLLLNGQTMSLHNRTPPQSPRAPKIQQQSWDDCGTPPISLYEPDVQSRTSRPPSKNQFEPRSPKSPRSFDKSSMQNNYYNEYKSPKSPRKFTYGDQRSPILDYDDGNVPRSPKIIYSNGDNSYDSLISSKLVKSPNSSRKFVFDAVSPRNESKNGDFYDSPSTTESTFKFCEAPKYTRQKTAGRSKSSRKFDHVNSSHDEINLDESTHHVSHHDKRHSILTESTLSESEVSGTTTTARCDSISGTNSSDKTNDVDPNYRSRVRSRRHAINITSNPMHYQVLHTSHSTLDRTCSDSVVSLRYRKSTSDLTDEPPAAESNNTPVVATHKRRGSSKGGLAYLASRRSSRESMKSATSNASIFSNEDIGPLAFQASARGRQRRTSNFLELPIPDHIRPRVFSLPERPYNPRQSDDLYRLRTFSISKGTVVNCGDSIISRRSRTSERSPFDGSCCGVGYTTVDSFPPSPTDSEVEEPPAPRYRVVMMGDSAVGKTALVSQFMTSEYMQVYCASLDDEFGEKTINLLLDGEETEMVFIDHPSTEMSVENSLSTYEPHSCVVVYSITARSSFQMAEEIINYLWRENVTRDKVVILVGNKADLARARVIQASEGKSLAQSRGAKFIETSSGLQHNVDELLVGILKQIRLKETRDKKSAAQTAMKLRNSKTHMSLTLAREILQKICLTDITKSKSCENLHVL
ncbi:GTP-binding protein GEM [Pseudolycoriella hygida]|uniref:GTP-binding protein GEM n=1 Tax=Pseudolycoriella hygida TaxID=35572 RepID=A0A9Q0N822_9DIPT|nr:GTP-binding protein GEM [Pseudolycoriella hygida]